MRIKKKSCRKGLEIRLEQKRMGDPDAQIHAKRWTDEPEDIGVSRNHITLAPGYNFCPPREMT